MVSAQDSAGSGPVQVSQSPRPFSLETPEWLEDANREALAAQGRALYETHQCGECHDAAGVTGNMDLATLRERRQYQEVIDTLGQPPSSMPLLPLEEIQKRSLAVYLLDNNGE